MPSFKPHLKHCQENAVNLDKPYLMTFGITLYSIDTHFNTSKTDSFEKIVGKKEIAHKEQFLLFPQSFSIQSGNCIFNVLIFDIISLFAAELEQPKIGK